MKKLIRKFGIITVFILFVGVLFTNFAFAAVNANLTMEAMQAEKEGNLEKMHIVAQKIISANPDDPYGYNLEAKTLHKAEKYEEAINYYTIVIEKAKITKEKDSAYLRKIGMSEQQINQTLDFNQTIAFAYGARGLCFFELAKPQEALNSFLEAEKYTNTKSYTINCYKAMSLAMLGKYDSSLKLLDETKKIVNDKNQLNEIEELKTLINNRRQSDN